MKLNQIEDQRMISELISAPEIYVAHLTTIGGIPFTNREIDVLACILSGRSAKKIASFLSIASKTVESHIRNIMLKLECNSQESIIDFVEKTDKFLWVKKYYSALLIQSFFEQSLKQISNHPKQLSACTIIHPKEHTKDTPIMLALEKDFNRTGIKTKLDITKKSHLRDHLKNTIKNTLPHPILVNLSHIFLAEDLDDEIKEYEKLHNISRKDASNKNYFLFFSLNCEKHFTCSTGQDELHWIDPLKHNNYYCLFFELFKKLSPDSISLINRVLSEFNEKYKMLNEQSPPKIENNKTWFKKLNFLKKTPGIKLKKKRSLTIKAGIIFSLLCLFSFVIWHQNYSSKHGQNLPVIGEMAQLKTWNIPRQEYLFVGREELLKTLDATQAASSGALAIVAYAGLGGIGKTQLALQFIHHSQHPYTFRAWFPAENPNQLREKYIEFSKVLGYQDDKSDFESVVVFIKKWLKEHPGWLIVYDNVNNYDEISNLLPEEGGNIIITTRNQNWPTQFKIIPIDIMSESESLALIKSLTNHQLIDNEENSSKELAKLLGYLPLALAQASAYIHQSQITVNDYLELYKHHQRELLADNTLPQGTHTLPVAITWNIILDNLVKEAKAKNELPLALHLLCACSYLAPEKIPRNLLLTWLKESYPDLRSPELVLPKLISQLWKYSMISIDKNGDVTLHRLVQAVIRDQQDQSLKNKNLAYPSLTLEWYHSLMKSIHDEFSKKTYVLNDECRQKSLLPHLQCLEKYHTEFWPKSSESNLTFLISDIGHVLYLIGDLYPAKAYYERALPLLEQHHGKNYPEVADILTKLGNIERVFGNAPKSKILCEKAFSIMDQGSNNNSLETAPSLECLGNAHRQLGDSKQAAIIHERAFKIKKAFYDHEHIEMASPLIFLARDYRQLGHPKYAKSLLEQALKIKENYYGKHHVEVAHILDYLAIVYQELGDIEQAKRLHEQVLKIKEQYFGKNHIRIAYTLNFLGQAYRKLGLTEQAKKIYERALTIKEKHYNHGENVDIAFTLDFFGLVHRDLNDIQQAKLMHEQALKIKENYYGKSHHKVAETHMYLGIIHRALKDLEQSKHYLENSLMMQESYYGQNNINIAETLIELSKTYKTVNIKQARLCLDRALKIRELYFGTDHILTKQIKHEIRAL